MEKIITWKDLWLKFVKKKYKYTKTKPFCKDKKMILYAVDCGGYDITNEVILIEKSEGIFLEFYDEKRKLLKSFKIFINN